MSADDFYSKEHTVKKCPYCFAYLPLNAKRCTDCHKRIGEVDKLGFAVKPFDWLGYTLAIVAILALGVFVWWGFLRE